MRFYTFSWIHSFQDQLFQVKYSVSKMLLLLVHRSMEFPIQDQYMHTSKDRIFHLEERFLKREGFHNVQFIERMPIRISPAKLIRIE